jgi:hypothetical protein
VCMIVCAWGGGQVGVTTEGITDATSLLSRSSCVHACATHTRCTHSHTHTHSQGKSVFDSEKRRVTKRKARPKLQGKQFTEITEASGCG